MRGSRGNSKRLNNKSPKVKILQGFAKIMFIFPFPVILQTFPNFDIFPKIFLEAIHIIFLKMHQKFQITVLLGPFLSETPNRFWTYFPIAQEKTFQRKHIAFLNPILDGWCDGEFTTHWLAHNKRASLYICQLMRSECTITPSHQ